MAAWIPLWIAFAAHAGPPVRTTFNVKYVAAGSAYLDGGRDAGLSAGMKLEIRRKSGESEQPVAQAEITSVASTSAVCELSDAHEAVRAGDIAYLAPEDEQIVAALRNAGELRKYAQVVTFTEGDPLDEEAREAVPKPPLPEINRRRGRIGFDYTSIRDRASATSSYQAGMIFRGDMTRIGGSYWNLSGYWRGRLNARHNSSQADTLTDLMNRTYHLTLSYENPRSNWHAGFGRFYLPWATSLDTMDGGYLGRRISGNVTAGIFAGSTPDPTSWNYNPDRQILGSFVSYERGSFDAIRYTTTAGVGVTRLKWKPEREFLFVENTLMLKRGVSLYHNLETDEYVLQSYGADPAQRKRGPALARSFMTLRLQPARFLALDFSHNYYRVPPTSDIRLVGIGKLDRMLFQGLAAGLRLDLPFRTSVYTNLGRSDRTGDARRSLNQMYGLVQRVPFIDLRMDLRYSKFNSPFGAGTYRVLLINRDIGESLRLELQAGSQDFRSPITADSRARFVNGSLDWMFATHYFLGAGLTAYRGRIQNYDQVYFNLGYRF